MNVLIIGAHGKIGKLVAQKMKESDNFSPTAFIRKEEQKPFFDALGISVKVGSLENSIDEIAEAMIGMDGVVFTAGSGGKTGYDKTLEVDLDGAVKSMLAAEQSGVKRYVMVSAYLADDRSKWEQSGIKPYYIAKHFADKELQQSLLDYTIIRPVRLTDEDGIGKVTVTPGSTNLQKTVPREDVATTILEVLKHQETIGKVMALSTGDIPVEEAILSVE
ncbi:SDR family oxidoreductase [Saccharicrinis sp. FJH2]|uniref:SDR family oxidoreductase n=1 Tax=Saccharicrinis sp. FJH65 TaxID=3344659 RepID=UPI0035F44316